MEYCAGGPSARVSTANPGKVTADLQQGLDVALGWPHLYSQGVEHRDLQGAERIADEQPPRQGDGFWFVQMRRPAHDANHTGRGRRRGHARSWRRSCWKTTSLRKRTAGDCGNLAAKSGAVKSPAVDKNGRPCRPGCRPLRPLVGAPPGRGLRGNRAPAPAPGGPAGGVLAPRPRAPNGPRVFGGWHNVLSMYGGRDRPPRSLSIRFAAHDVNRGRRLRLRCCRLAYHVALQGLDVRYRRPLRLPLLCLPGYGIPVQMGRRQWTDDEDEEADVVLRAAESSAEVPHASGDAQAMPSALWCIHPRLVPLEPVAVESVCTRRRRPPSTFHSPPWGSPFSRRSHPLSTIATLGLCGVARRRRQELSSLRTPVFAGNPLYGETLLRRRTTRGSGAASMAVSAWPRAVPLA